MTMHFFSRKQDSSQLFVNISLSLDLSEGFSSQADFSYSLKTAIYRDMKQVIYVYRKMALLARDFDAYVSGSRDSGIKRSKACSFLSNMFIQLMLKFSLAPYCLGLTSNPLDYRFVTPWDCEKMVDVLIPMGSQFRFNFVRDRSGCYQAVYSASGIQTYAECMVVSWEKLVDSKFGLVPKLLTEHFVDFFEVDLVEELVEDDYIVDFMHHEIAVDVSVSMLEIDLPLLVISEVSFRNQSEILRSKTGSVYSQFDFEPVIMKCDRAVEMYGIGPLQGYFYDTPLSDVMDYECCSEGRCSLGYGIPRCGWVLGKRSGEGFLFDHVTRKRGFSERAYNRTAVPSFSYGIGDDCVKVGLDLLPYLPVRFKRRVMFPVRRSDFADVLCGNILPILYYSSVYGYFGLGRFFFVAKCEHVYGRHLSKEDMHFKTISFMHYGQSYCLGVGYKTSVLSSKFSQCYDSVLSDYREIYPVDCTLLDTVKFILGEYS